MPKIALYCRVSTETQEMDRQLEATSEYAEREFGADLAEMETYRDKSTGTNTKRDGYREMMNSAAEYDAVVVHSVSRICRSISDLERTAGRLEDNGTALHIVSEGLTLQPGESDPYQTALFQLLGVFAELEAAMTRQRTREGIAARQESDEDYHHGRPPLGFDKEDGYLVETDQYDQIVAVLDMVKKGNLSKRKAGRRLGCARSTISEAAEKTELYGL